MIVLTLSSSLLINARDYVITEFGAKNDTTVLSTEAVQRAIDACSENGGRVVVPAGSYKIGTIVLKSNALRIDGLAGLPAYEVELRVAANAYADDTIDICGLGGECGD